MFRKITLSFANSITSTKRIDIRGIIVSTTRGYIRVANLYVAGEPKLNCSKKFQMKHTKLVHFMMEHVQFFNSHAQLTQISPK